MNAPGDRWEHGSEFHWPDFEPSDGRSTRWLDRAVLLGSGRDALRFAIDHGRRARGWTRLWIPTYFCQEVVESLLATGIPLFSYGDGPLEAAPALARVDARPGDVVLVVNHFGLRQRPSYAPLRAAGAEILEDHTHDPFSAWSLGSDADICVASLRKVLPVAIGGAAWMPRGDALPAAPPITDERAAAAAAKTAGMLLKALYLRGHPIAKDDFRALLAEGEATIASGAVSGADAATRALLTTFPVERFRDIKRDNARAMRQVLEGRSWLRMLEPSEPGAAPFSCVVVFDTPHRREHVRRALIEARIYPAILWPMDKTFVDVRAADRELSATIASVHCDLRYEAADARRVAEVIVTAGDQL